MLTRVAACVQIPHFILPKLTERTGSGMGIKLGSGSHTYEWIDSWAKLPSGKEFGYTHGVVCDKADNVYIFNTGRDSLCVFDPDGKFIRSWGTEYKSAHGLYYTN